MRVVDRDYLHHLELVRVEMEPQILVVVVVDVQDNLVLIKVVLGVPVSSSSLILHN